METVKDIVQRLKSLVSQQPQQQPVEAVTDAKTKLQEMAKSHKAKNSAAGFSALSISRNDLMTIAAERNKMAALLKDLDSTDFSDGEMLHMFKTFYKNHFTDCLDNIKKVTDKFQI